MSVRIPTLLLCLALGACDDYGDSSREEEKRKFASACNASTLIEAFFSAELEEDVKTEEAYFVRKPKRKKRLDEFSTWCAIHGVRIEPPQIQTLVDQLAELANEDGRIPFERMESTVTEKYLQFAELNLFQEYSQTRDLLAFPKRKTPRLECHALEFTRRALTVVKTSERNEGHIVTVKVISAPGIEPIEFFLKHCLVENVTAVELLKGVQTLVGKEWEFGVDPDIYRVWDRSKSPRPNRYEDWERDAAEKVVDFLSGDSKTRIYSGGIYSFTRRDK